MKLQEKDEVTLTFLEIETILDDELPDSLRNKSFGWLGTAEKAPTHVWKKAWENAGYRPLYPTDIITDKRVTFKKISDLYK
ncbi:hypothetical protein RyT2_04170 [Pseudolactococcus yaeyamensis]